MAPSLRSLLILTLAGAGVLAFTGCADDEPQYRGRVAYEGPGPGDYDAGPDYGPDVDFYYVGGRPYSRDFGVLYFRDGGYYYRHGDSFVIYNRARGHYGGGYVARDRYHGGYSGDYRARGNANEARAKYGNYDSRGRARGQEVHAQTQVRSPYAGRGGFQRPPAAAGARPQANQQQVVRKKRPEQPGEQPQR